jgi:release factor glutamine methyltransferase
MSNHGVDIRVILDGATVAYARRAVAQSFRQGGLSTPDLDARILICHVLGLDHAALVARSEHTLSAAQARAITALSTRRLAREPVARITGKKEFWGLAFGLVPDTLVPRPDSETVVTAALAAIDRSARRTDALRILDIGTGSGALLLALLSELPAAQGVATDVSLAALTCARQNARTLNLADRSAFVLCDQASALGGPYDLGVANPPYVGHDEIAGLEPEVRDYDPPCALDGGADGLDAYRAIATDAKRWLKPHGRLVVELGIGQIDAVLAIFSGAGLVQDAPPEYDLAGIARAIVVKLRP